MREPPSSKNVRTYSVIEPIYFPDLVMRDEAEPDHDMRASRLGFGEEVRYNPVRWWCVGIRSHNPGHSCTTYHKLENKDSWLQLTA